MNVEVNANHETITLKTDNGNLYLTYDIAVNSCGVTEINDLINFHNRNFKSREIAESIQAIISFFKKNKRAAFVTFSVPRQDSYTTIISVLNKIKKTSPGSVSTTWRKNPNTDNMIKVWIF